MKVATIGTAVAALGLIGGICLQLGPALAYQRLQNLNWLRSASPNELRATAHEALAFRLGDPHDAFGVLEKYGDKSSIPYLRAALARQPSPSGAGAECTWIHGQHALDRAVKMSAHSSMP